ncbi:MULTISPECIES: GNAT family N-acetyltransferase [Desulfococcus]|uniref:GCN5-related N-acetyltransferase n=1 Tax=Desulfococcus multivorans DSM 2059 TaxID=1121405 RepID=S7TUN0_DESML|nr:GNAT family N-acetyltransferase [Desulfococcus multivorans]AOY59213.1 acetyltransferase, GNAT family [Desulfococcus multivorans]AQV01437.1 GNAT family N-acetyltransferase [Desulfococcus multivorans]EPR40495.1 GCN5-related N-acetyltransferase [Desulfococcus multivorans DSM 2059]SKA26219.1 Acetyltransferase (GNAT) family protein [Desulfococcus multivorans DSM 2059]
MENIRIRELEPADADDIAHIYAAIVRKPVDTDFKDLIEKHTKTDNDICVVAELNGHVIGFMISYIHYFGFGLEKSAWIATLGVQPEYMGHGIGNKLAEETFNRYEQMGIRRVYTSVRWDSTDLLSFFKNQGFDRSKFINLKKRF